MLDGLPQGFLCFVEIPCFQIKTKELEVHLCLPGINPQHLLVGTLGFLWIAHGALCPGQLQLYLFPFRIFFQ